VLSRETVLASHAARLGTPRIPWLTNKDGKQENAKEEENEAERHEVLGFLSKKEAGTL